MDKLPVELILNILERLELKDLENCRLANRLLSTVVKLVKIDELALNDRDLKMDWYLTDEQPTKNWIEIKKERSSNLVKLFKTKEMRLIRLANASYNLKHLRCLMISCEWKVDFGVLNSFQQLESLWLRICANSKFCKLSLPKLKLLHISPSKQLIDRFALSSFINNFQHFIIDSPVLNDLRCPLLGANTVTKPETVDRLEVNCLSELVFIFKNLTFLNVNYALIDETTDVLDELPNLIAIRFYMKYYDSVRFESALSQIRQLIDKKIEHRRNVDIYFQGILVLNREQTRRFKTEDFIIDFHNLTLK